MDNVYTYQAGPLTDGLVDTVTTEHGTYDYGYDNAYRLTSVSSPVGNESYTYDGIGRRQPVSGAPWTYNANGAPLSTGAATYTYDTDGNRSTKSDGVTTSYFYDESNRLVRVERPAGNVIARYGYDPLGERLWKEVSGQRTYYSYNGDGLESELDSLGNVTKSYIFAPGSEWGSNPLGMKQGSSFSYYHNDHQGRPVTLTNNVGAVTWSGRYSAYGVGTITSQGATNPIRAPGQYSDPETGLYHNFQRNYDPELGVYIEEDPYGVEVTGPNRYLYVGGEPVLGTDPTGEIWPRLVVELGKQLLTRVGPRVLPAVKRIIPLAWGRKKVAEEGADFAVDEALNDFPAKRCYEALRDPCQTSTIPPECYEFFQAHGPSLLKRRGKNQLPGMGVDGQKSKDLKTLSDKMIQKLKKKAGFDPHDYKPNSRYNIFYDKKGDLYIKPIDGSGPAEPLSLNFKRMLSGD
jgi:RHS repeat-associated protein